MKHELSVTLLLIGIFVVSQLVGLFMIGESMQDFTCDGNVTACKPTYETTIVGERPETEGFGSVLYLIIGVTIGTIFLLLIAKYKKTNLWRTWFFLAVVMATSIALGTLIPESYWWIAWLLALGIASWKLWWPNVIIYNIAEVLMYAGIAVLIAPILDVFWMIILLLLISLYDAYAVWKSKHMVKMAKFITHSNAFAGLVVPYKTKGKKGLTVKLPRGKHKGKSLKKGASHKSAILGGGDITFPLLFGGVVLQQKVGLFVAAGVAFKSAVWQAFGISLFIALGATLAVAGLFFFAKKDTFYPAMPFITTGCLLGWLVTLLF